MQILRLWLVLFSFPLFATVENPGDWAKKYASTLLPIYKGIHAHPELSNFEQNTAALLARSWKDLGIEVTEKLGGFGVVGVIRNGNGPTVLLRTDLDALPIEEKTGLDFASKVKAKNPDGTEVSVMHACGHDIHITNLIGVARYLTSHKEAWSGSVVMIGQPAEERGQGALRMLKDGLFKKFPKPDYALALHVEPDLPTGKVGFVSGYAMANADFVDITLLGKGGHGAAPHSTIDPIVLAAQLTLDLQTLVSRESNPVDPTVLTVGSIHGGTKHNIIPESVKLQVSIRSYSKESRKKILDGVKRKTLAVAQGAGAPEPLIKMSDEHTPAVYNDPALVDRVVGALKRGLGEQNVVPRDKAMVSEDFSRYHEETGTPIFLFRLGSINEKRLEKLKKDDSIPSLHSGGYYPDAEESLQTGISAMSWAVLELLKRQGV